MKKYLLKKTALILLATLLISFSYINTVNAQITPTYAEWVVDGKSISLEKAYKEGITTPQKLSLKLHFDKSLLKKYSQEQLKFEFKWFYYYVTQKEFMDSYTVSYNANTSSSDKTFTTLSSRGNIRHGWWEVQVVSKADGQIIKFGDISRFQIYVN